KQVLCVDADAEAAIAVSGVDQRRDLLETAADRSSGSGRVLDQQSARCPLQALLDLCEGLLERLGDPRHHGLEAGATMAADVEDDALGSDAGPDDEVVHEAVEALRGELL